MPVYKYDIPSCLWLLLNYNVLCYIKIYLIIYTLRVYTAPHRAIQVGPLSFLHELMKMEMDNPTKKINK